MRETSCGSARKKSPSTAGKRSRGSRYRLVLEGARHEDVRGRARLRQRTPRVEEVRRRPLVDPEREVPLHPHPRRARDVGLEPPAGERPRVGQAQEDVLPGRAPEVSGQERQRQHEDATRASGRSGRCLRGRGARARAGPPPGAPGRRRTARPSTEWRRPPGRPARGTPPGRGPRGGGARRPPPSPTPNARSVGIPSQSLSSGRARAVPCQTVGPWRVMNPQAKADRGRGPRRAATASVPVWNTLTPTRTTTRSASVASGTQGVRRRRQASSERDGDRHGHHQTRRLERDREAGADGGAGVGEGARVARPGSRTPSA